MPPQTEDVHRGGRLRRQRSALFGESGKGFGDKPPLFVDVLNGKRVRFPRHQGLRIAGPGMRRRSAQAIRTGSPGATPARFMPTSSFNQHPDADAFFHCREVQLTDVVFRCPRRPSRPHACGG